jgi:anionic cell wall polymer biosynthesis LytR-Cps2A-Psr (LCP) family protein
MVFKMLKRIKSNWQNILIGFLLLAIFIIGFFIVYDGLKLSDTIAKNAKNPAASPTDNSYSSVSPAPLTTGGSQKGVYNILFLGYGGAGHDGSMLTDSIIVIHIDTATHKTALISIPRDLWVNGGRKINAEGSTAGFENVGGTIQNVTGLHIDHYVAADFGGFTKIIDNLGGVSVQVPATFSDSFYPITGQENNTCGKSEAEISSLKAKYSGTNLEMQFTCRYEQIHYDKGPANLDGTTALKFVRSRHGDSDFARSLRQFAVLAGIENKLISAQGAGKINSTIDTLSKIVKTDLSIGTIKTLIQAFGDTKLYSIKQIQLTTGNVLNEGKSNDGAYILIPKAGNFNFTEIQNFIKNNL